MDDQVRRAALGQGGGLGLGQVQHIADILVLGRLPRQPRRIGHGVTLGGRVDPAGLDHPLQHQVRAGQGGGHVDGGRQAGWGLGQGGEQRRLRQGQGAGRLVEVGLGRGLHAVGAGAEEHPVEIELEDLILAEAVGQSAGQHRLLQLAFQRAVGAEEQGLRQLLGQARGPLHRGAGLGVGVQGAQHRQPVDGPMLVEPPVFGREEGVRHIGG